MYVVLRMCTIRHKTKLILQQVLVFNLNKNENSDSTVIIYYYKKYR